MQQVRNVSFERKERVSECMCEKGRQQIKETWEGCSSIFLPQDDILKHVYIVRQGTNQSKS